ncbi:MAG: hypothetical protein KTR18_10430 [Acidiferrobacterales bacterium]|nr:hypothetical protein [Acidiferrobacterales bacterium]
MRNRITTSLLATLIYCLPATLLAQGLSAEEIAKSVSDHTYQGSMTDSAFAEYYAPDGSIHGKNYSGKWRTEDNKMCFQYGDKAENCWDIETRDSSMTMIKDGVVDGNGMLVKGNVHGY